MGNNAVLARHAEPFVAPLRAGGRDDPRHRDHLWRGGLSGAAPGRRPGARSSKPKSCGTTGREPRDNPRFVITNLRQTPEWIYTHVYCARGDSENRFEGTQTRPRLRAHQLHALLGQSIAHHPDRRGVRPVSRAATARGPDRAPRRASPAAPAGADHDRRAGRPLRPPDRPAFPAIPSGRRHVDASRPRARRRARVSPRAATRHGSSRRRCRSPTHAPSHGTRADPPPAVQTVSAVSRRPESSSPPLGGARRGRNSLTHE